jgi:pimeloyl-ACP methyl ester carboxylesterase
MSAQTPAFLATASGHRLAYVTTPGTGPTLVWLGGFHSDMTGTKAIAVEAWARNEGRAFVRFDYSGHGQSDGAFADGTISAWLADSLEVVDRLTQGPLVLVGSSMGGWLALLVARARPQRVQSLCLIAPAPDFTEALMWDTFPPEVRQQIETTGAWQRPSAYAGEGYPITRALIQDGRRHLLLHQPIAFDGPVRILQGQCDDDVPWTHALRLAGQLTSPDLRLTLVKAGDHRLSTPADLALLCATLRDLTDE